MLVVATKIDVAQDPGRVESVKKLADDRGLPFFAISSVTGKDWSSFGTLWPSGCSRPIALPASPGPRTVNTLNNICTSTAGTRLAGKAIGAKPARP